MNFLRFLFRFPETGYGSHLGFPIGGILAYLFFPSPGNILLLTFLMSAFAFFLGWDVVSYRYYKEGPDWFSYQPESRVSETKQE